MKTKLSKRLTKIFAFICTFSLVAQFAFTGLPVAAATTNVNYVVTGTPTVGNTIDIAVNVTNISDLYGASVDFTYDPTVLEVQSITKGSVVTSAFQCPVGEVKNGQANLAFTLTGADTKGITANGTIAIIKAKVLKGGKTINLVNDAKVKLSNSNVATIPVTAAPASFTTIDIIIPDDMSVNFGVDKKSSQLLGYRMMLSASAKNATGDVTYKFYTKKGTSTVILSNSTKTFVEWIPAEVGTYTIGVVATDSTGKSARSEQSFVITENYLKSSLVANKPSTISVGTTVGLTASCNATGAVTYKIYAKIDGSPTILSNSSKTTANWTPTKPGKYLVGVVATDSKGTEARYEKWFVVN